MSPLEKLQVFDVLVNLPTGGTTGAKIAGGLLALSLLALLLTFSRSAWIGMAVAAMAIGFVLLKNKTGWKVPKKALLASSALLVVLAVGLFAARDTYLVQNIILHADESTVLEDPNELRLKFWQESVEAAAREPLGYGPGTAGIVSIRNDKQGTVLNENYYLQILHEVGIIGLILFVAILCVVTVRLYRRGSENAVTVALLGAFAGLFITNFLVHIWSNEAVAYTFWGLAGLVVYSSVTYHNKR